MTLYAKERVVLCYATSGAHIVDIRHSSVIHVSCEIVAAPPESNPELKVLPRHVILLLLAKTLQT